MTKEETRQIVKKNEEEFQSAYDMWLASGKTHKPSFDKMWFCVDFACSNISKSMLKGIDIGEEEFHNRYMDAVCYVMEFIKNRGVRPTKLSSYCYLRCKKFLQSPQNKFYDLLTNLEYETQEMSNNYYTEVNNG